MDMRTAFAEAVALDQGDDFVDREAAKILGTSRQHRVTCDGRASLHGGTRRFAAGTSIRSRTPGRH